MRKSILITLVIVFSIILLGCSQKQFCKSPYIEFQVGQCCLDQNNNSVCDNDETLKGEGISFYGFNVPSNITSEDLCSEYVSIIEEGRFCKDSETMVVNIKNNGKVPIESIRYCYYEGDVQKGCKPSTGLANVNQISSLSLQKSADTDLATAKYYTSVSSFPIVSFNGKDLWCQKQAITTEFTLSGCSNENQQTTTTSSVTTLPVSLMLGEGLNGPLSKDLGYMPAWVILNDLISGNSVIFGSIRIEIQEVTEETIKIKLDERVFSLMSSQIINVKSNDGELGIEYKGNGELHIKRLTNPQGYRDN